MASDIQDSVELPEGQLVELLQWLTARVQTRDSAGGFLEFEWSETPGVYNVRAGLRFGNSEGQGSMRLIQKGLTNG